MAKLIKPIRITNVYKRYSIASVVQFSSYHYLFSFSFTLIYLNKKELKKRYEKNIIPGIAGFIFGDTDLDSVIQIKLQYFVST
jgi:hypothetical protein